jgi:hypothetical protein
MADGSPEGWTDERRRGYRLALAARRERQVRAGQLFGLALIGLVAAGVLLRLPEAWWVPAVGAVALAGLVYRMVNWTCPSCGERLPTRRGSRCPGCGAPLDE